MAYIVWMTFLREDTIYNMIRCVICIVNHCILCKQGGSIDHLLFHCSIAQELWTFIFVVFGIGWVMLKEVRGGASVLT